MTSSPVLTRVAKTCLYLLYLCGAVLLIIYVVFWGPFVGDLENRAKHSPRQLAFVPENTRLLLGSVADAPRPNRFFYFDQKKPKGVLRICTLGDSNTFGSETTADLDYPSYLHRMLQRIGAKNVQVVNFGNGWYGFSQTFIMWRDIASDYACDLVVIMPFSFWHKRDTTFNHSDLRQPRYLHARYVLDGDGIKLTPVSGQDGDDRFRNYFSFVPNWRYLRYDRSPPAIVRSLLPEGKTLANWFYYDKRDPVEEAQDIYQRLLAQLVKDHPGQVVAYTHDDRMDAVALRALPANDNLAVIRGGHARGFPYDSPIIHRSPWGNELRARILLTALLAETKQPLNRIKTSDIQRSGDELSGQPFAQYKSVYLEFDGQTFGVLVPLNTRNQGNPDKFLHSLHDTGIVSLLAFKPPRTSLADACLVALDFRPPAGSAIQLSTADRSEDQLEDATLGVVHYPNPRFNIAVADIEGFRCSRHGPLKFKTRKRARYKNPAGRDLVIVIGNHIILTASSLTGTSGTSSVLFETPRHPLYRLRSVGSYPAAIDQIQNGDKLQLVLESETGTRVREDFLRIVKYSEKNPVKILHPLKDKLRIENGRASLVTR